MRCFSILLKALKDSSTFCIGLSDLSADTSALGSALAGPAAEEVLDIEIAPAPEAVILLRRGFEVSRGVADFGEFEGRASWLEMMAESMGVSTLDALVCADLLLGGTYTS